MQLFANSWYDWESGRSNSQSLASISGDWLTTRLTINRKTVVAPKLRGFRWEQTITWDELVESIFHLARALSGVNGLIRNLIVIRRWVTSDHEMWEGGPNASPLSTMLGTTKFPVSCIHPSWVSSLCYGLLYFGVVFVLNVARKKSLVTWENEAPDEGFTLKALSCQILNVWKRQMFGNQMTPARRRSTNYQQQSVKRSPRISARSLHPRS